ncbi:putative cadmium resistance protein (CadD) [Patulibacter medicamentivorans]|uniref:Putative cadmium resistance protein (CadD) n=1 Tax=Patulibacter medicamentivorans TaxID=1097667 RepID=H0DZR6_9ACTN|nr:cadmium resistance transporter [Patulibacter medicamentivorans]EHN13020.1 putative cadmium resistance protein (CadD) [Patulibacter medicamentivorans]
MLETLARIATAAGVFVGTNVDDLIVLTVLFLAARAHGRPTAAQIWAGQYAGVGLLVAVSAIAALGLVVVPDDRVGLLGLVPLALGLVGLRSAIRSWGDAEPPAPAVATGFASVAAVTLANGADNISVYTPMLRSIDLGASLISIAVFAVLVGAWCALGSWLGSHRPIVALLQRHGHWLVPVVFVAIGVVILLESGALGRL